MLLDFKNRGISGPTKMTYVLQKLKKNQGDISGDAYPSEKDPPTVILINISDSVIRVFPQ